MQTMTSAYANKLLRSLEEDKAFWVNKEATSCTCVVAVNEEPVVPEYKYINYDLELIKKEYESVSVKIMEMQMALDKYNQTAQFEVDI